LIGVMAIASKPPDTHGSGVTKMKTRLFLAATLCTLAANTYAADGYDKTGSAAFTARAHTSTAAGTYASESVDKTIAVAAAEGVEKTATGEVFD
jgi:hypothetical protein